MTGTTTAPALPRASEQDGTYPRPQLVRPRWADLAGPWGFASDPDDLGVDAGWWDPRGTGDADPFDRTITVPFPPESEASGIGDRSPQRVVWYRRELSRADLDAAGLGSQGDRLVLRFGAVDHAADVWLDGQHLGRRVGGQTPFSFDVTGVLRARERAGRAGEPLVVVARAEDDPEDVVQPRGKQDWRPEPHVIWYDRTTGIWQPVWLEAVPALHLADLAWEADLADGSVLLTGRLSAPVPRNAVASYLGLRSVEVEAGWLLLNDRPFYVRSVLEQGYWPESLLTAPSADALREEVRLIKELGFNSARIHQKAEDPRFLFWCDKLGLTVWGETANAYAYSPRSVELLTREWLELVRRDRSHPSIITWVPLNESWGVQHGAHDARQQHYGLALAHLTKALDPTRPVVSNDGWEHTDSDIWSFHDYTPSGDDIRARYGTPEAVEELLSGVGPAGRRMRLDDAAPVVDRGQAVMLTEFGGVSYAGDRDDAWGYSEASDDNDFARRLGDLLDAVRECRPLVGFCWTQLTDTGQETNGLLRADRTPKLPVEVLRRLVTGEGGPGPAALREGPGRV